VCCGSDRAAAPTAVAVVERGPRAGHREAELYRELAEVHESGQGQIRITPVTRPAFGCRGKRQVGHKRLPPPPRTKSVAMRSISPGIAPIRSGVVRVVLDRSFDFRRSRCRNFRDLDRWWFVQLARVCDRK